MAAIIEFECAEPVGTRTCGDLPQKSGGVRNQWLESDISDYASEHDALVRGELDPRVTKRQHLDILGVLHSMKRRAEAGQLPVGHDSTYPARVMARAPHVIELRPGLSSGPRPPRLFRLYYAEPAIVSGALLPLVLSTKPNAADMQQEQNASIDDAQARSRVWTLQKALMGGTK